MHHDSNRSFLIIIFASIICSCSHSNLIYRGEKYVWTGNSIIQDSIKAYAPDSRTIISNYPDSEYGNGRWELTRDISRFASYSAPTTLEEAVYNITLQECEIAVEPDSTLRTGKEWGGVWTRDISYSIILGMAQVNPECSMKSLMRKVNSRGRIIQDTGTGGSWPCSTDRSVWVLAAWEIYKVTGNSQWLHTIYPIVKASLSDDLAMVRNPHTGMFKGESSYLDWRQQEYPVWMKPIDIYNSENLGTECIHSAAFNILSEMENMLGDAGKAAEYASVAAQIADGVNKYLWQEECGYYGQYLYGRKYLSLSPRFETLGEALTILYGIAPAERARRIIENGPCEEFGTACFYPHIPDMFPYHNDAMWPFVQAFWTMAAARSGNPDVTLHGISSIMRAAAFFLTNKENMVLYNGKWQGTAINSSRQLWSIAGSLSLVYRTLFGMEFGTDRLSFHPMVPRPMKGTRKLENFRYRNSTLDIILEGYGAGIKSFTIDGKRADNAIPGDIRGHHTICIKLDSSFPAEGINRMEHAYSLQTPAARLEGSTLTWEAIEGADSYAILRDGTEIAQCEECSYELRQSGEYQVIAKAPHRFASFAGEPVDFYPGTMVTDLDCKAVTRTKPYYGFKGSNYIPLTTKSNTKLDIPIFIKEEGSYFVDFLYSNANGLCEQNNKCANRTLLVDGQKAGMMVFPQCGEGTYGLWQWSNCLKIHLTQGEHILTLLYTEENVNMNIEVNDAALDCIRITPLALTR